MTDEPRKSADPEPAEQDLADRLSISRPVPGAGFRGRLYRYLAEEDPGYGPRPERLRLLVAGYIGAGGVLIALVVLGVS